MYGIRYGVHKENLWQIQRGLASFLSMSVMTSTRHKGCLQHGDHRLNLKHLQIVETHNITDLCNFRGAWEAFM